MLSRVAFWGVIIALQSDTNIWYPSPPFSSPLINEDLRYWAGPQLVFTFDNRFSSTGWAVSQSVRYKFFLLQPSYFSATSHTGRKSCRDKSLYMKRFWSTHCPATDKLLKYSDKTLRSWNRWSVQREVRRIE
jgi:hypothetical protein